MDKSKPVSMPLSPQFKLSVNQSPKDDEHRREMDKIPYANIVGSIMYTMVCTRPDISQGISVVSRYMADPGLEHWHALKWILRYLNGTQDYGILFDGSKEIEEQPLMGYCDSDFATNIDTRKSQSGYVFCLYGAAVSWRSSLQSVVALSTTEAEYISMSEAVKESIWLKGICSDFGVDQETVTILCDSNSAICLSKHQTFHERSKHVDVKLHFVRDEVDKGSVKIQKVATEHNASDMLTKVLPGSKLKYCMDLVNLIQLK
ncbi:secreted RxLR effector protein 161-like [Salvia splendens]|uniref:secreted RxLR effector protein 161-like n=1 Tax=Salvia splendens TaxID=180675 RepID=UPI001C2544AD|nr:secreted RxLR effector protein 161-like [Salvia splendens]